MKKTKLYAKKTLSVFMAVMMLMTAWVFVAPEKASAASSYPVTINFDVTDKIDNGGHILVRYYEMNADGSVNYNAGLKDHYITTSLTGSGCVNVKNGYSLSSNVPGWPYEFSITTKNGKLYMTSFYIGNINVLNGWVGTTNNETKTWRSGMTVNNITMNWPVPAIASVRTPPTAQTISVPKTGSASKTFTATFNDQYGVQWPTTNGMSVALSPALSGATVTLSGNTATVTANLNVFNNAAYNSSNGQIKTVLQMIQGGKTASCDVTFQAPKYNAYLNNFAGNTVKTYSSIGFYNQSVTLTGIPENTAATKIEGNDDYHQTYQWPAGIGNAFNIINDTTYTEVKGNLAAHSYNNWAEAGDSHTRTCSVCGYVQTQGHTVDYNKGYETKKETCTEDGVMTYDCITCGKKAIETSVINQITGHNFTGDWVMNVDGKDGSHYRKCIRFDDCGTYGYDGVAGDSCAHEWCALADTKINTPATCTTEGEREYNCTKCTATYTEVIPATGHPADKVKATAAKNVTNICGGDGNAAFWTCSVCNKIYTDASLTTEISDYTDADSDSIPDILETKGPDHDFTGAYVNVTDGAEGTHYRQCARYTQCGACGLMVDGQPVVGATEKHKFTSNTVNSSCTVAGKTTYSCPDCKYSYAETLPLAAHNMETIAAVTATCTTGGNNKYYKCTVCSQYFKDEAGTQKTTVDAEKIGALGHTFITGGDVQHPETDELISPATCMAAAVYKVTCDRCGLASADDTYSYGSPDTVNGHKFEGEIKKNDNGTHSYKCLNGCETYGNPTDCAYEVTADVASTCKTAGYTTYKCKVCGNGYSETKALDSANHEGEETKTVGALDAKCNSNGYTGDIHCLGCDAVLEKGESIPADPEVHPHENMKDYEGKAATCQDAGYSAYRYCDQCGTYETEKVSGTLKAHRFTQYTSNGNGTHTATCDTCDAAVATPATDTKDCAGGTANCVDKAICSTCGGEYGDVDSANHKTVVTVAKVDPTCQTVGTVAYRKCSDCNTNIDTPEAIDKLAHNYGAWAKVEGEDKHTRSCTTCVDTEELDIATETEACSGGTANCVDKAKCTVCKAEYGTIDPAVHKTTANTLKDVVDATCQAPGFTGNYYYNCCNALKEAGTATAQLAHTYDIEVEGSRTAATCIAKGEVTYKCSTCVESEGVTAATQKKELDIDAKNHATPDETVIKNQKAATCEEDGHTGDVYYKCCYDETKTDAENRKALKEKGTVIKANGQHVYGAAIPEYMIERIDETKDEEGKVTSRAIVVKQEAPDYEGKIAFRHGDNKWYHAQQCTVCNVIVYSACYTYAHTFNCVETDTCEVCEGLCSLIDENKHKADLVEITEGAVEATCIADGKKSYYKCADCGKTYFDEAGKNALDLTDKDDLAKLVISKETVSHKWDEGEETEGTCGTPGKIAYKCTVEGCTATKEISTGVSSQNHTWKEEYEVTKEPTCHSVGYKVIKCEVCESVKPNSAITLAATGEHDFDANKDGTVDRNDAAVTEGENCQKPGTLTFTCQNEGCTYTKTEIDTEGVSAHSFGEWVSIGGDCSTGVVQERTCDICGVKEQQTLTTDTHELVVYVRVEPTPEKDGYVIYECANCKMKTEPTPIKYEGSEPADEHIIDKTQYRTVKEATCIEAEKREYTCLRCGEKIIMYAGELLPHYWLEQPAEVSTCEKEGHSAYYRCVYCLEERDRVNYEALGHADNDGDGKCDNCNSAFYGDGEMTCGCICHKEGWFMQLIYKIVNFFWKLFKINHSCACGATHY